MTIEDADAGQRNNPWPKHHQVYLVLRQQIEEGAFVSNEPLPNEFDLADQFAVSRITVRKAMERLDREGWVERHRGRGTFARQPVRPSPVEASVSGTIENLIAMGLRTNVKVLSVDYVAASAEVAAALRVPIGSTVQKAVRLRSLEGRFFSHLVTYVPEELGRAYGADELARLPLLVLLEQSGVKAGSARQSISATLATPEIGALLGVDAGSALLAIRRVVSDEAVRPIEYIKGLYRPDTYEHQMTFERGTQDGGPFWAVDQDSAS
ncbi:MAG: GntR family transcriptional regulator [Aliihoeflea sp.]